MSFFEHVDLSKLSETDRFIYNYLADNRSKVPYMRIREIAEASHTSSASVMRFIRKIGYSSFVEFRANLKLTAEENPTSPDFFNRLSSLSQDLFPKNIEMKLEIVADTILDAENIMLLGMGASGAICDYAARRLATIGYNAFALTDPTYPVAQKLKHTANNIIIILSVSGATNEVIEVVNTFKNKDDFTIITITADEVSILAQMSNYVLPYQTPKIRLNTYHDMSSQIQSVFLVEALIQKVWDRD